MNRFGIFKLGNESFATLGVSPAMESIDAETAEVVNPLDGETVQIDAVDDVALGTEFATISAEVDEIQRATTAVELGEQTAQVAEAVAARGNVTPEEAALVQAGAAQTVIAAGGNEEDAAQVAEAVATESYDGITISTEGFKDFIKNMWQNIKDFVSRVIQGIKNAWNRFWNSTSKLKKKAEELKKKVDDYKDELETDKIEKWKGYMTTLADTGSVSFDIGDIVKVSGTYATQSKNIGAGIKNRLAKIGEIVKKLADAKSEDIQLETVKSFVKETAESLFNFKTTKESKSVIQIPGVNNFGIAISFDAKDTVAETVNSFTAKQVSVKSNFNPKKKEPNFKPLALGEIKTACDNVVNIANGLDDWYNKGSKTADDDIQKLRKSIDDIVSKVEDGDNGAAKNAARGIGRLYVVPTQLLRASMALCVHYISVGNAVLAGANDSLSCHKKDKKD